MDKTIAVAVIGAIGGISATVFLVLFSGSEGLLITPRFDVSIEQNPLAFYSHDESITIKNTGWAQAKNVEIFVTSAGDQQVVSSTCPEGEIPLTHFKPSYRFDLRKMSQNIDCVIEFGSNDTQISSITVTADNAPGYQKIIKDGQSQIIESNQIIQYLTYSSTIIAVVSIVGAALGILKRITN